MLSCARRSLFSSRTGLIVTGTAFVLRYQFVSAFAESELSPKTDDSDVTPKRASRVSDSPSTLLRLEKLWKSVQISIQMFGEDCGSFVSVF